MAQQKQVKINKFKKALVDFSKIDAVVYLYNFMFVVIVYGILLSFLISTITTRYQFNLQTIIAFGLVFYFISEEMPKIIFRCKAK